MRRYRNRYMTEWHWWNDLTDVTLVSEDIYWWHLRLSFTIGKVWNVSATHSFNSTCSVPKTKCLLTQAIVCTNTDTKKGEAIMIDWRNTLHKYKYKIQKNIFADQSRSYDQWRNNWLQLPPTPPTMSWTFAQCFAILPFCQWFTPKDPIEGNFIDLELSQDLRGGRFE